MDDFRTGQSWTDSAAHPVKHRVSLKSHTVLCLPTKLPNTDAEP